MFALTIEVDDAQEKNLTIEATLATLNDQPIPSAQDWLQSKIDAILGVAEKVSQEDLKRRREEAIKNITAEELSQIDTILGLTDK